MKRARWVLTEHAYPFVTEWHVQLMTDPPGTVKAAS